MGGGISLAGEKSVTLWFDDRIVLELAFENVKEVNTIRGENPTGTRRPKRPCEWKRRSASAKFGMSKDFAIGHSHFRVMNWLFQA